MKREKIAAVTGIFAGLTMLAASPAVAQQADARPVIASYLVRGGCVDLTAENETRLGVCAEGQTSVFRFMSGRDGMITVGDNKCLTAAHIGEALVAQTCADQPNQRWRFASDGTIRNAFDQCIDVERVEANVGVRVIAWQCHGRINQLWYPAVAVASVSLDAKSKPLPATGTQVYIGARKTSLDNVVAANGAAIMPEGPYKLVGAEGAALIRGGDPAILASNRATFVFKDTHKRQPTATADVWSYFSANGTAG